MRVQDVAAFWENIASEPDAAEAERKIQLHYLSALAAIASGHAEPDPQTLAMEILHQVSLRPVPGREPDVRFVQAAGGAQAGADSG